MTNGNNGSDRLNLLVDQIGRLTEQIAASNIMIANGFAETRTIIENGFSELKTIAQAQQHDINRLVEVTDRQAKTVEKQAETVDRLALMLEQVLGDRSQNN